MYQALSPRLKNPLFIGHSRESLHKLIQLLIFNFIIYDVWVEMPKIAKQLNDLQLRPITKVGWHAVGGVAGLLLQVRKPTKEGAQMPRSWILRIKVGEQRQPIGLGSYPQLSLGAAREQAAKLVVEAKQGVNLKAKKRALRSSLLSAAAKNKTFKECAEAYMDAHSSEYTSDKHRKQWPASLETYAYPVR